MKVLLRKLLYGLWWLTSPIHQPLKRKCRDYLCACLDRQLKQNIEPLLTDLHLRLDNLVREQDRLLTVIEYMQDAHQRGVVPGWHEAEPLTGPPSGNKKRSAA